jgi:hypothetical protein
MPSKKSTKTSEVTCACRFIVEGDEYEALTEVDSMMEKEFALVDTTTGILSKKATLIIIDSQTTTAEGCGINYKIK